MGQPEQPAAPPPTEPAQPKLSAEEKLQAVIERGMANIESERAQFAKMLEAVSNPTSDISVGEAGWDEDLLELFNLYGGSPLTQLVFTQVQTNRWMEKNFVMLQAMAASMAGVPAPETEAAVRAMS